MASGVGAGAAVARSPSFFSERTACHPTNPWKAEPSPCPEIDCVRALLAPEVLIAAENRAASIGVGADRVLVASGALEEETYLRALADSLGIAFEPLDSVARTLCPIGDERLIESAASGLLPLIIDDNCYVVVAPRRTAARKIITMIEDQPAWAQRFRFTSTERLNRFIMRHAGVTLAGHASEWLHKTWPLLSAIRSRRVGNIISTLGFGLTTLVAVMWAPTTAKLICEVMLAAIFLAWLGLRLTVVFFGPPNRKRVPRMPDDRLPIYTVIAALYREAASVNALLSAIERLDYPGIMAQTPQA